MQLIVGLKNPGKNYANTRHNVGAWLIERICYLHQIRLQDNSKFSAYIGQGIIHDIPVMCVLPTTYMNHSGRAVQLIAHYYNILPTNITIAHDDLDLPPGKIKLKIGGGHGGHNGLRDIICQLNSNDFKRIRIGIGHPKIRDLVTDYVLHQPTKQEFEYITAAINNIINILPDIVTDNWQQAMNKLN